jgi:hypothetical protein
MHRLFCLFPAHHSASHRRETESEIERERERERDRDFTRNNSIRGVQGVEMHSRECKLAKLSNFVEI